MKMYWGVEVSLHEFLTSALEGSEATVFSNVLFLIPGIMENPQMSLWIA
jgi:hypothetical protein